LKSSTGKFKNLELLKEQQSCSDIRISHLLHIYNIKQSLFEPTYFRKENYINCG
jgi:hypothetical protein